MRGKVVDIAGSPVGGAIIIAAGDNSAAYAYGAADGSFTVGGIKPGSCKVTVMAYGYEPTTVDAYVPSSQVIINLTRNDSLQLTKMLNYKLNRVASIEEMYSNIVPVSACSNVCSTGRWWGYSADATAIFLPMHIFVERGYSFSIGRYHCLGNFSNTFDFSSFCTLTGLTNAYLNAGVSSSLYYCTNACCGGNFEGSSTGAVGSVSTLAGFRGVGGALDFSGGTTCYSLSPGIGVALTFNMTAILGWAVNPPVAVFAGYRECETIPSVNIFEYYFPN